LQKGHGVIKAKVELNKLARIEQEQKKQAALTNLQKLKKNIRKK
jgi:hypothetical protein